MDWLVFAVGGMIIAAILYVKKSDGPMDPVLSQEEQIADAIAKGIVRPLGLPDEAGVILRVQSKLETGSWRSRAFVNTRSLFNRHIGSGRGDWVGSGKNEYQEGVDYFYAGAGDTDLRVFTDVYQSARDMAQLLSDPLYTPALSALRRGSAPDYYNALKAAGFAADPQYAQNLLALYQRVS